MSVRSLADTLTGASPTADVARQPTNNEGFFSLRTILVGNQTSRTNDPSTRPLLRMPTASRESTPAAQRLQRPTRAVSTRPLNSYSNCYSNPSSTSHSKSSVSSVETAPLFDQDSTHESTFAKFVPESSSNSLFQFNSLEAKHDEASAFVSNAPKTANALAPSLMNLTAPPMAFSSPPSPPTALANEEHDSAPIASTASFLQSVGKPQAGPPGKGLELVGGSKRINELTGELAVLKDDLRQAHEQLESKATTISCHEQTIRSMQTAHEEAQQKLQEQLKQAFEQKFEHEVQARVDTLQAELEAKADARLQAQVEAQLNVRLDEQSTRSSDEANEQLRVAEEARCLLAKQLEDAKECLDKLQCEQEAHIQRCNEAIESQTALEERVAELTRVSSEAVEKKQELELLVSDMTLENDTLKVHLEKTDALKAEWDSEREALKEAFKEQYEALEAKLRAETEAVAALQTTANPANPADSEKIVVLEPEQSSEQSSEFVPVSQNVSIDDFDLEDHPVEHMRQTLAAISTVVCDFDNLPDHNHDDNPDHNHDDNLVIGICKEVVAARNRHPLRDLDNHHILLHAGGGLTKLDEAGRMKRCSDLDAHISSISSAQDVSIGEKVKGSAENYMHSNMLDIAAWIKRQQADRPHTRMVSIGY